MTTEKFKQLNPQHANLEGEALWNAMEDHVIQTGRKWIPLKENGFTEKTYDFGIYGSLTEILYNTYICEETGETKTFDELWNTETKTVNMDSWRMEVLDFGNKTIE